MKMNSKCRLRSSTMISNNFYSRLTALESFSPLRYIREKVYEEQSIAWSFSINKEVL